MSNLVHNEQVKLAATFWNNLGVAALLGVFLVPAFYTRHTMLQQALSIGRGAGGGDRPSDGRPLVAHAAAGVKRSQDRRCPRRGRAHSAIDPGERRDKRGNEAQGMLTTSRATETEAGI